MNRKHKIKQMKRFIYMYGNITQEYKRSKDSYYRRGSYFAVFDSKKIDMVCCVTDIDQYRVYKNIVKNIKMATHNKKER